MKKRKITFKWSVENVQRIINRLDLICFWDGTFISKNGKYEGYKLYERLNPKYISLIFTKY